MSPVRFHPEARRELRSAASFYRDESKGLGKAFVADVRAAVAHLADFPASGAPTAAGVRRILLRRFPYALMYRLRSDTVEVLAAMHQRREPGYWEDRLQDEDSGAG